VHKVQLVRAGELEFEAQLALRALKESQVLQVLKEDKALRAFKVLKGQ